MLRELFSIHPVKRMLAFFAPHHLRFFAAIFALTLAAAVAIASARTAGAAESTAPTADAVTLDFSLPRTDGDSFALRLPFDAKLRVVCFLGCDCPVAKLYAPRLKSLAERFKDRQVEFIGINSNPQDPPEKVDAFARQQAIPFPMLKDHDGQVAAALGATRTPEVVVIDPLGRVIYRGRVDDQYRPGVVTDSPQREDLAIAIEQSLGGQAVEVPITQAAGCLIAKRRPIDPAASVTFTNQVSRILNRHCVECHRPGEIGPFALTDYDEVIGWADMMLEVIDQQRMPPWHASELHGVFANTRRMPEEDKATLRAWVDAGTPFGKAEELPIPVTFHSGWQLGGEPDQVVEMAATPFTVPAEGSVDYQYFVADPGFTEDRWVKFAEVVPGNRGVVHHAIVFIRPPDGVRLDGMGWLTAYVPGQRLPPPSDTRARKIPAGSKLVFQMHYTPNGKVESDLSKLGLVFADPAAVTEEVITLVGINQSLEIPPREPAVAVEGMTDRFPSDGKLLAISPHMHLRGKAFQVRANFGDKSDILLDVPHYDFNWQHTYVLKEPMPVDAIRSLDFTATYDNSPANPFNPDPDEFVTWGDQTWEEMAIVFYEVARPRDSSDKRVSRSNDTNPAVDPTGAPTDHESEADRLMKDLDRDGDGKIVYDEVERAVQIRLFRRIDTDDDRVLDRDEVLKYIKQRR